MAPLSALVLAAVLASPTLAPPTPPPEPNHVTIEANQGVLGTTGQEWQKSGGASFALSGRYEFQAGAKLRFANTVHWERLSSVYTYDDGNESFNYTEYNDEFDVELGRPEVPTGLGVGYFFYKPVDDASYHYNLGGFGVGVDHWPNYYVPRSVYYSLWYYPDARGKQNNTPAYADRALRCRTQLSQEPREPVELPDWPQRRKLARQEFQRNRRGVFRAIHKPLVLAINGR
ncbi:MAG: hypothetical protein GIW97_04500 [Candidatus Eremiobacteraeota bacterium]|nr:hypothetical protein [Candidatus Eremiobacteraeota bacterium]